MQKVYKLLMLAIVLSLAISVAGAQEKKDTVITNVDADLINIFNQKAPKKYKISAIKVTGNSFFDENLLISIANVNVGDEIVIPGGDLFSKAITKLWGQNYFSDVEIFITKLEDKNIEIEIAVTERARLSNFLFKGVSKSDAEDLTGKTGLVRNRVITENMKISAVEAIKKFYAEKGFQSAQVKIIEKGDTTYENTLLLDFVIDKGPKVRINNINFGGNTVESGILKKKLKK